MTYILFQLILLSPDDSSAQAPMDDSSIYSKGTRAFSLAFRNSDSAMILALEALRESSAAHIPKAMANAYNSIGWAFMHQGRLDSSIFYLEKSLDLFSSLNSEFDMTRVNINLAEVYTKQFHITEAIQRLLQADSLSIKLNNIPLHTDVKRQLAIVYRESGDKEKSARYFREALDGFTAMGDYTRYVNTGVSLSILYRNMNLPDSSLNILNQCKNIARQHQGTPYQNAMIEEHLAETYLVNGNYSASLGHYSVAYKIFEELNNKADLAYEGYCIGKTYSLMGKTKEAEHYLQMAYAICDTLNMTNYLGDISGELSALYEKTGNWQKAYQYLHKYNAIKDTLAVADQVQHTNELKEKFETQKKEQEILLLKTQSLLDVADNRKKMLMQYFFILLLATSTLIGGLLYNRVKIKKRLQEQLLRNQLAGDLHDDIGSALSSIDISSRIALMKKEDAGVVEAQLYKIRQQAKRTMDSMGDIVWSISPDKDTMESLVSRMKEFGAELLEPQDISLRFEISEGIDKFSISPDKRKNLFLLYKEAINNAAKYSQCKSVTVVIKNLDQRHMLMKIKDDGMGFDTNTVKKGNGLKNMSARAEQMDANLLLYSKEGEGTHIELGFQI